MNRTKKVVSSISTAIKQTRRSAPRCSSSATWSSQTYLGCESNVFSSLEHSVKVPQNAGNGFRRRPQFCGRIFCSESDEKRIFKCWNCEFAPEKMPFLFCESCRTIQPVDDSVDYYQIFDLDKKYEIDVGSLEGKYKDWQKKLHPDLVHNKSEKERDYAAGQSGKVTEAYRTLTKPLSRAMYIMRLNGMNINEEDTIRDPQLLMEIMELREAIAEANDSKGLNEIRSQVQEKLKQQSDSFVEAIESHKFDEAVTCIQTMTYYERACEEISKKM